MPPPLTIQDALHSALAAEYKARAACRAVLNAFGLILPFATIIRSEQRHIDTLLALLSERGLPALADPHAAGLSAASTVEAACRHAMLIEEELSALYDQLTSVVSDDAELAWVFRSLRRACFDCHIPLFRRHLSAVDPSASAAWECRGEKLRGLANAKCCFLDKFPEPEHV